MAAVLKKPVPAVVKTAAKPVAGKTAAKPVVKKPEGFEVMDMASIQLIPKGGGGGKALSAFSLKVFSFENGQGIKISEELYKGGKGVASLYAGAKRRNIKLRVRKDVHGQLWLFRVTEEEEAEAIERAQARAEAEAAAQEEAAAAE